MLGCKAQLFKTLKNFQSSPREGVELVLLLWLFYNFFLNYKVGLFSCRVSCEGFGAPESRLAKYCSQGVRVSGARGV